MKRYNRYKRYHKKIKLVIFSHLCTQQYEYSYINISRDKHGGRGPQRRTWGEAGELTDSLTWLRFINQLFTSLSKQSEIQWEHPFTPPFTPGVKGQSGQVICFCVKTHFFHHSSSKKKPRFSSIPDFCIKYFNHILATFHLIGTLKKKVPIKI